MFPPLAAPPRAPAPVPRLPRPPRLPPPLPLLANLPNNSSLQAGARGAALVPPEFCRLPLPAPTIAGPGGTGAAAAAAAGTRGGATGLCTAVGDTSRLTAGLPRPDEAKRARLTREEPIASNSRKARLANCEYCSMVARAASCASAPPYRPPGTEASACAAAAQAGIQSSTPGGARPGPQMLRNRTRNSLKKARSSGAKNVNV